MDYDYTYLCQDEYYGEPNGSKPADASPDCNTVERQKEKRIKYPSGLLLN